MTDRELLEMAAKAAGIKGGYSEWYEMGEQFYSGFREGRAWGAWNPLTDDGDALRLALTLKLDIYHKGPTVYVGLPKDKLSQACPFTAGPGASADDIRRAIVRAAAAIGMAM